MGRKRTRQRTPPSPPPPPKPAPEVIAATPASPGDLSHGERLLLAVIVVVTVLAYQPTWAAGFIWDDDAHVTAEALRSWSGLGRIWFELGATQQYYPLLHSFFWLQSHVFGYHPTGYHLVNLALHTINVVLVARVLRRLGFRWALWGAGLFALHPVMVESVAWITEQKNTLSTLFYLTAALAYLRFDATRHRRDWLLAAAAFVLGLLTKTVTATLPAALLVVFWWQRGHLTWRRDIMPTVPLFMCGAAGGLFTAWVERKLIGAEGAEFAFTLIERGLIAGRVVVFYLGKLLWPAELIFHYPRWTIDAAAAASYIFPGVVAVGFAGLLLLAWRRHVRGPLAGGLIFVGTLFPVLGFFNVYPFIFSFVADHFQYLAALAVFALATAGAALLERRLGMRLVAAISGAILLLCGGLTWRQSRIYSNAVTLYRATIAANPDAWMAQSNLGSILFDAGRLAEALPHLEAFARLRPREATAHYKLAIALIESGRIADGMQHAQQAFASKVGEAAAHGGLALALARQREWSLAIAQYEAALDLDPDLDAARTGLGDAHLQSGLAAAEADRWPDAVAHFEASVRHKPEDEDARLLLGDALLQLHRPREAVLQFEAALRLRANNATAHSRLGHAWLELGQPATALEQLEAALRLDPELAEAHFNAGRALAELGRWSQAAGHFEQTLRLEPAFTPAREALDHARRQLNP